MFREGENTRSNGESNDGTSKSTDDNGGTRLGPGGWNLSPLASAKYRLTRVQTFR